jgi:lysozyme
MIGYFIMRKINQAGIEIIKQSEGCRLKAYKCPAGVWTIGYGHTKGVVPTSILQSQEQAEQLLYNDLLEYSSAIESLIVVPLNDNQFSSLVSFIYNVGINGFKNSTLRKKLNTGDYNSVPEQMIRWTKGGGKSLPGLVKRRNLEIDLFRKETSET